MGKNLRVMFKKIIIHRIIQENMISLLITPVDLVISWVTAHLEIDSGMGWSRSLSNCVEVARRQVLRRGVRQPVTSGQPSVTASSSRLDAACHDMNPIILTSIDYVVMQSTAMGIYMHRKSSIAKLQSNNKFSSTTCNSHLYCHFILKTSTTNNASSTLPQAVNK